MIVKQILGRKVSFGGEEHSGWLPAGAATPKPTPVELVELDFRIEKAGDDEGYFLIWEDQSGRHCGDTWHQTIDDAVAGAEIYFSDCRRGMG
jgi:hypothetical protein